MSIRYRMHVSYYGTGFIGWQRQAKEGLPDASIQTLLETSLRELTQNPKYVHVVAKSRTDAGTHALWQLATFCLEQAIESIPAFILEMNTHRLPPSVRVQSIFECPKSRTSGPATLKKYVYYIAQGCRPRKELQPYSWYTAERLNVFRLREALRCIEGSHDFQHLAKANPLGTGSSVRTLVKTCVRVQKLVDFSLDLVQGGAGHVISGLCPEQGIPLHDEEYVICIEIVGAGFLRHMVRRIVGCLRSVGEGQESPDYLLHVIHGTKPCKTTAPARGLWLQHIQAILDEQ